MVFGETFWLILLVFAIAVGGVAIERYWHVCARVTKASDESGESKRGLSQERFGVWLVLGVAMGTAIGGAMGDTSAGIAIGVGIGIALASAEGVIS